MVKLNININININDNGNNNGKIQWQCQGCVRRKAKAEEVRERLQLPKQE